MSYCGKRSRHIQAAAVGSSEEDRLSALPESIIIDILSLLPFRSVVVTSVLSSQWHHLWTQIHSVSIHYTELKPLSSKYNLINIVKQVLQKLTSPCIRKFYATLGYHWDSSMLYSWFRVICARKVEEISLSSNCSAQIPSFVFQTKSLVVLEIGHGFWFNLPCGKDWEIDINLPSLKKLKITHFEDHIKCVESVVNSCPLLEELFVDVVKDIVGLDSYNVVHFSGHNLKVLELVFSADQLLGRLALKFMIDAPNLEYFTAGSNDYCEDIRFTFVKNPTLLLGVRIWKKKDWLFPELIEPSSNFHKTISLVASLELDHVTFEPSTEFANLTRLELRWPSRYDLRALIKFLGYCPALEVLVVNVATYHEVKYISSSPSPICLRTRLKKIEVKIEEGIQHHKYLINMVKYLLRNSKVLQQLTFRIDNKVDGKNKNILATQSDELQFCEELFSLPKSSLGCQINFVGECYKVSSSNVNNVLESW